jgi:hypothetical protein
MTGEPLRFNGIDGSTGRYLQEAASVEQLARRILDKRIHNTERGELQFRKLSDEPDFGVVFGCDPEILSEAGWGLVAAADTDPDVLAALTPLCELRRQQAGERFRAFTGSDAYLCHETKQEFLARFGMGPSSANPDKVPYYLLLVGDPDTIPYHFQYQLDIQYAVGRIAFDTAEEYGRYAQAVVKAESESPPGCRSLRLFGPRNPSDTATAMSATQLVVPMMSELASHATDWEIGVVTAEEATKARLGDLLWGDEAPDLLFIAGHGMAFPAGDRRQREAQGALLCQDWPGPLHWNQPIEDSFYLAGNDLPEGSPVRTRILFAFACFGAGTPLLDDFPHLSGERGQNIADQPFVARLPQRVLAHASGGALAFVGHVERAWGFSFSWPGAGAQREVFTSALRALMAGWRVGHAMEFFNARYAELSSDLSARLDRIEHYGEQVDAVDLACAWIANNDARSYVVVGDPAVRISSRAQPGRSNCETREIGRSR